jgi:Ni/Fe-hydrogenase subunit HybB-like protein
MNTIAREAALRPFGKSSALWKLTVFALTGVVLFGVYAWVIQFREGMGVAGYNDHAFWAIYIADAITFIGVSYGGAVVSAILRLTGATWRAPLTRMAEGMAIVTVLIGTALIVPHIGNPILMWKMFTQPNVTSPVFWDLVAVSTYTFASIVFFTLPLVPDMAELHKGHKSRLGERRATLYASVSKGWVGAPQQRRVLAGALGLVSILIIPLAVSVHSNLAWIFATTSRPWWHESIWAPQFVIAALYSGVALVILVVAGFRRGYHLEALITERHFVRLGFILATFAATYLYFTFADILPGAYVGDHPTASVFTELLVGRLAPWFWLFAVVGGLIPLLLVALPWTRNIKGMVLAALLVVPMLWLKRILMVTGGGTYDTMTGAFGRFQPTWIPIVITLAATAAIPLLLMLLFRIVPIVSIDEIEEIDEMEEMDRLEKAASVNQQTAANEPAHDSKLVGASGSAHRVAGATGVLLLVALLSMVGVGGASHAQAAPAPGGGAIVVAGTEAGGSVNLKATLFSADGLPLAETPVEFSLTSTQFGPKPKQALIGTVKTGTEGTAEITYKPTAKGQQKYMVSTVEKGEAKAVTATTTVNVTVAQSAYKAPHEKPLSAMGGYLVMVLLAIVAGVWLTLGVQIWRLRRVCRIKPTAIRTA